MQAEALRKVEDPGEIECHGYEQLLKEIAEWVRADLAQGLTPRWTEIIMRDLRQEGFLRLASKPWFQGARQAAIVSES